MMGIFLLATAFRPALGYTQGALGTFFPRVKWRRGEADHSPPSGAEVKNAWSYTFTIALRLHGVVLRYRKNFTVHLLQYLSYLVRDLRFSRR
jgi:hypothetical protein